MSGSLVSNGVFTERNRADNASGLAISSRMTSQIRGLDMAVKNANDAISMVNTAEGALDEVTAMLQRVRELAVQSGTGTTSAKDRTGLNEEYKALMGNRSHCGQYRVEWAQNPECR